MSERNKTRLALWVSFLVFLAMTFYRHPDAFLTPWFYAEEGKFFYADAVNSGWGSIFHTQNGYYHFLPRLVSLLSVALRVPFDIVPAVFSSVCLSVYFLLTYYIFYRIDLSLAARCFMALAVVLVPVGNEIMMNLTNIQWVMAFFPVILFFGKNAAGAKQKWMDGILLFCCAFTGPYVMILFPLFFYFFLFRGKSAAPHLAAIAVCFAGAVACIFSLADYGSVDRTEGGYAFFSFGLLQIFFRQYYFPLFSANIQTMPEGVVIMLALAAVFMLFIIARKVSRSKNHLAAACFMAGLLFFAATLVSYRKDLYHMSPIDNCIRNFYLPMVFLLWSLIAVTRYGYLKITVWLMAYMWFVAQTFLYIPPRRFQSVKWKEEIQTQDTMVIIPIHPPGWEMKLRKTNKALQ